MNSLSRYKIHFITSLCLLACLLFIRATFDEIVNDKNKQIDYIQKQIDDNRSSLRNGSAEMEKMAKDADSIESSLKADNDFLKDYQDQNFLTPEQIAIETNMVLFLEDEVESIQQSFKNKIINLYKHGKNYELELLMSSKTPNEFLRRNEYLQRFAQSRKKDLRDLKAKKLILEEKKKMLNLSVSSQRYYVEQKRNEKSELEESLRTLQNRKIEIQNEDTLYTARIEKKEQDLIKVKDFLSNFTDYRQFYKGTKTSRQNYSSDEFEKLKGTLNLPVDFALIENEYGDYVDNASGAKAFSSGIDFSIAKDSKVYAVASGVVSLVGDAPYYGKVIIINHDNGYRTVYACLGEVNISAGDKVKLNQIIGRSGESPEGQIVHFEIWKDVTPLNPKEWVKY